MKATFSIVFVLILMNGAYGQVPQAERLSLKEDAMMRAEAEKKLRADHQKMREDRAAGASPAQRESNLENLRQDRKLNRELKAKAITDQTEQGVQEINERGRQGRP